MNCLISSPTPITYKIVKDRKAARIGFNVGARHRSWQPTFQTEVEQHILVHSIRFGLHLWSLQGGVDFPGAAVLRVFQFPQAAAHGLGGGDSRSLSAVGAPEEHRGSRSVRRRQTDRLSLFCAFNFNGTAPSLLCPPR